MLRKLKRSKQIGLVLINYLIHFVWVSLYLVKAYILPDVKSHQNLVNYLKNKFEENAF